MEGNTIYAVVSARTQVGSVLCWWWGLEAPRGLGCVAPELDVSMAAAKTTPFCP